MTDRFAWTDGQIAELDLVPQAIGPETEFEAATRLAARFGWTVDTMAGVRHNEPGSHPDWNGFGHYSDGDDWGVSKQAGYRDTLTGFQLEGLQVFKGNNYTAMNAQLRTGKPTSTKVNGLNLSTHIANAKDAIARDKAKVTRNMVVYRGMESKHIAANFDKVKVGHEFSDKGFNSTSFNPSVANNFAAGKDDGIVIKVHLKRGTHAAYLDHPDIDKDEFGESEMLLHPNTKYRVLRARVDKHGNKVLSVEVVHDGVHAIPATGAKKRAAPLLSTPEGAAPEFVHEGGPCPKARPERFGVNSLDLVGADDMIYLEDEEGDTPGGDQKKRASSSRARAPFTPAGAGASLPPGDPAVDDDDVDEAVDDFDEELPDYAGLLDADVVEE
jgi:hypothetical protein